MLKRVFPDRQPKTSGRNTSRSRSPAGSSEADGSSRHSPKRASTNHSQSQRSDGEVGGILTSASAGSSANSSPLKSSIAPTPTSRHSSSSNSPVKSEGRGSSGHCAGGDCQGGIGTNLSKLKNISRSCSSTEFQSLKLESMSTVEDFKSVSKTISSNLEKDGMLTKQSSSVAPALGNDVHESTSLSTPSDEDGDGDPTDSLFKQQAKFFYQMKEYLLSQQSSLRQHLELLNATVATRKKKLTARRQRYLNSGHSVHLATKPKPEVTPEIRGNNHDIDLINEFHSCSSTEKSDDDIQVCPLCGVEIEDSENPAALEEHVASHWCSPDDPI